jgi:flagellin
MALSINTNIASLNAQRNLARSQSTLNTSLQRLSTGLRINSAKDDAAGLAISTRFTTQIRGLDQAVRNANDGISLAQTGDSALEEITNNLQRIRELAVQSANATNSASDRAALDAEVQQRLSEINRIGGQTSFNGRKILDGSFGTAQFQVGANVGETISVNLSTGVKASQLGQIATATGTAVSANALTDGALSITVGSNSPVAIGASADGTEPGQTADSAYAKADAINSSGVSGLTAIAQTSVVDTGFTTVGGSAGDTYSLSINGIDIYAGSDASGGITAANVAAQINTYSGDTGVTASYDSGSGELTLSAADGRNIAVDQDSTGTGGFSTDVAADQTGTATQTNRGSITLSSAENIEMTGNAEIGHAASISKDSNTLATVSIATVAGSNDTILRIDAALTSVSDLRSEFGAVQSRFESTITNLQSISENLTASRGRILDADFAAETANLTRAQILQQAGTTVLAQANQVPQAALTLLQG